MKNKKFTNRLINETSPYLLQHAHNPVDWYAWGNEAFEAAKRENKPILISIGYSTCHWCHVMEKESFENEDIAEIMNNNFINIKIDREERPDIDAIYMEAIQIMTGSGGWPLNCFLLPDGRPFYGGTYFPPFPAHNRPSWGQVLVSLSRTYQTNYDKVVEQADKLTNYIQKSENKITTNIFQDLSSKELFNTTLIENLYYKIRENFDRIDGGFGYAPKFPSTMTLKYCLDYYYYTKNEEALDHVILSLNKMIQGGIYDQIGGGFSRYSTDKEWLVPHFEKMLYDNALLIGLLSDAYKATKNKLYKQTIIETLTYIEREMLSIEGGFYSAQDADSEGIEGKYYVWDYKEIKTILQEKADIFIKYYNVQPQGNWEGVNILHRTEESTSFNNTEQTFVEQTIKECSKKLFDIRNKRVKPSLDDKILLNWNALTATAYLKAYTAIDDKHYLNIAIKNITFLINTFKKENEYHHTYKNQKTQYSAFLDDYAFLIETLLTLFEITQDFTHLDTAKELTDIVINNFLDTKTKLFYFTNKNQTDLIMRKKDLYDSALPSGNATMAHNLHKLGILLDNQNYINHAQEMLINMLSSIEKFPSSFSHWSSLIMYFTYPTNEIAIIGKNAQQLNKELQKIFIPNRLIIATETENNTYSLLKNRPATDPALIYICQNYTCGLPVKTIQQVIEAVNPIK